MPNTLKTDNELVNAMRGGDEDALGEIIDRYTAYVWTIVWNIVSCKMKQCDAKAVVSEVFYILWKNAERIRPDKLKPYLSRIARSRALDALKAVHGETVLEDDELDIPVAGAESEVMRRIELQALRDTLDELGEPDRTIFIRHYYYYRTTSDIADAMGMKVSTVQSRLRRGREKLRRKLTEGGYFVD